jgi:hypothetical protein
MPELRFATDSFDFSLTERTPGDEVEEVSMTVAELALARTAPESSTQAMR